MSSLDKLLTRPRQWIARLKKDAVPVPHDARHDGMVEELSARHIAGWLRDPQAPESPCRYDVILERTGEVLLSGATDHARPPGGEGPSGFWMRLPRILSEEERSQVIVRAAGTRHALPRASGLVEQYEPVYHIAMDIVDNCNLRCPFCVYDYSNTRATHLMTDATIDAALRFLPFVKDGEFWFSCLHEPSLHPDLMRFIDKVPRAYRQKIFYTTNLCKRMPGTYFEWLAQSGVHHINISIESRDPAVFERMRRGARHPIFMENWDKLMRAFAAAPSPPLLRYIVLAYKSNFDEIPDLVSILRNERRAWLIEVRHTFDMPFIPDAFRQAEYLDQGDWVVLRERLAAPVMPDYIQFVPPPPPAVPDAEVDPEPASAGASAPVDPDAGMIVDAVAPPLAVQAPLRPDRIMLRMSWDGSMRVFGVPLGRGDDMSEERLVRETTITDIADPETFLRSLT